MKKALNFRTILVCVLVLVMCVACFVACDKTKNQYDETSLNNARSFLKSKYDSMSASTPADYDLIVKAPGTNGVMHDVIWTVNVTVGDPEQVKVVPGEDKVTINVDEYSDAEVSYTLTATIKDGEHSITLVYEKTVPKFVISTYAEYVAGCEAADSNTSYTIRGFIAGVNAAPKSSSKGSLWIVDEEGHGYYAYAPTLDGAITETRDSINAYFPVGAEVVVRGTLTLYNGTYEFNKGCAVEKTGRTAEEAGVTLTYVDATEQFAAAASNTDKALVPYQATMVELKNVTLGAKDGKNYYFTIGATQFICYNDIYLMDDTTSAAFAEKWVEGAKANLKGIVNVYSGVYQIYPQGLDALDIQTQTDEEKVAGVKAALTLEESYEENFTLPTSTLAELTWKAEGAGATIGENNLVTVTRADVDQTVTFTATIRSGEASDTKTFTVTIPAIVVDDPNTVIVNSKNFGLTNSYAEKTVTFDNVTFHFTELGDYGDGIQMRIKNGVASSFCNTTAFERAIASVVVKLSSTKSVFDNADAFAIKFGNAADNLTETISFSTVKDQLEYTITPEGKDWTFMSFTKTIESYTFYFESITINYVLGDADAVAADKAALALEESYHANFNLPLAGANGTTINWAVKTETTVVALNATTGEVTINPVDPSTTITLVATIQKGSESDTKEINVNILKDTPKYAVTFAGDDNGTVTATYGDPATTINSGDVVEEGTVVTFTIVPNSGYECVSYTIGETTTKQRGATTFTATINEATTVSVAFDGVLDTPEKIVNAAYALGKNETLGAYTLTGVVKTIDYSYNASNNTMTVTIQVGDMADKLIKCFKLTGEEGAKVAVNDTITATGTIKNYNGTVEFDTCTLDARTAGTSTVGVDSASSANATVTITDGLTSGTNGTIFTFTVVAASGHEIVSVKVNGSVVEAVDGTYTGTIKGNTLILVETKEEGATDPALPISANFAGTKSGEVVTVDGWTNNSSSKGCYAAVEGVFYSTFRNNAENIVSSKFAATDSVDVTIHWYLNNTSTGTSKLLFEGLDAAGNVVASVTSDDLNTATVKTPADLTVTLAGTGIAQVRITMQKSSGGNIGFSTVSIVATPSAE